jgi:hypothetical protein
MLHYTLNLLISPLFQPNGSSDLQSAPPALGILSAEYGLLQPEDEVRIRHPP